MDLPFIRVSVAIYKILTKQTLNRKLPALLPQITPMGKCYSPHRRWPSARFRLPVSSVTSFPWVSRKCESGAPLGPRPESRVRRRILQVSICLRMADTTRTALYGYQLQVCRKCDLFSPQARWEDDGAHWVMVLSHPSVALYVSKLEPLSLMSYRDQHQADRRCIANSRKSVQEYCLHIQYLSLAYG
jgi:hypothetical protein